jgi:hypothetical protein
LRGETVFCGEEETGFIGVWWGYEETMTLFLGEGRRGDGDEVQLPVGDEDEVFNLG